MNANEAIKGTYSMLITGFEFFEYRIVNPPVTMLDAKGNAIETLKTLRPLTALALVSYDGADIGGAGGIRGDGVLKFIDGIGVVNGTPEPLQVKKFTILPESQYWIDPEPPNAPSPLTGRALFKYQLFSGAKTELHYYFVIEDGGGAIQFMITKALALPNVNASPASLWGRQIRISKKVLL